MNRHRQQSWWMLVASFLFACMGVCVKYAAETAPVSSIVFWRGMVALILVSILLWHHNISILTPHWRIQLFRGGSGFVSLLLNFYGIAGLPLATATVLNYTSPLFFALYLVFAGRLLFRRTLGFSLLLGFLGVIVVLQPSLVPEQWFAAMLALLSGVTAGVAYFNIRELGRRGEPELRTVFYFSSTAAVGGLLWGGLPDWTMMITQTGLWLVGVGVFGTLAQIAVTRAYGQGSAWLSASLAYTTVIFASLFGGILWGDNLTLTAWGGIGVICLSGILVSVFSRPSSSGAITSDTSSNVR